MTTLIAPHIVRDHCLAPGRVDAPLSGGRYRRLFDDKKTHAAGVVIGAQADMWDPEKGAAHQAAYEPFVKSIASHTTELRRPVLMFNGDSHVYQSGDPPSPSDPLYSMHPGSDVPNFHRVVVHGSTFPLEWLKLTVDPRADAPNGDTAFGRFGWQREIQP